MNKIYFAIALHFHQPIGSFERIFERAHRLCYSPFLKLLSTYPQIKMTFHISGCLLDYLEEKHPRTLDLVKIMVSRRQIEMMSGGYYEPILTAIPERDITGQIRMMSEYIKKRFNFTPVGMWVPERVWEPRLTDVIYDAGVRYTVLDESHLLKSGVEKDDLFGFFLTGKGKKKIAIFPSDKTLRYAIPFKSTQEIIDYFRSKMEDGKNILFTYGDDGEKFGEWPGTSEWVFEKNWLKDFFETLNQNSKWIKTVTISDYLKRNSPLLDIEVQPGSYEEMMEWTGGSWMNFLEKYPETNHLHKKMFYVSDKIGRIKTKSNKADLKKLKAATRELYKGQCNCAYWHGVFGGLYLFHLRETIYNHLINADKIADEILHKAEKDWLDVRHTDFDRDGKNEALAENKEFFLCVEPYEGGVLKELDYRPISFNIINTISRKEEPYHQKIFDAIALQKTSDSAGVKTIHGDFRTVSPELEKKIVYDRFPRYCLRNYFVRENVTLEDFISSSYKELGDFSTGVYNIRKKDKGIVLERTSRIQRTRLALLKKIGIKSENEIEIFYSIKNEGPGQLDAIFGIEFNLTMPHLNSDRYKYVCDGKEVGGLNKKGSAAINTSFGIKDSIGEFGTSFSFKKKPMDIWYFPVETVSQSERAYELNYQCSCIFPHWKIFLGNGKNWDLRITWSIVSSKR